MKATAPKTLAFLFVYFVFLYNQESQAYNRPNIIYGSAPQLIKSNTDRNLADTPSITTEGDAPYCPLSDTKIVTDVKISDPAQKGISEVFIQISIGYIEKQDLLTLNNPNSHPNISSSWSEIEGKITLKSKSGAKIPVGEFEKAIKDVQFRNSSPDVSGSRTFSISLGAANFLPRNGHYYLFFPDLGINWKDAKVKAEASNYYGLKGYLTTITALDEAILTGKQINGTGWIGATDAEKEGEWKWISGPEAGTIFWNGNNTGSSPNFAYWHDREPNNMDDEDYGYILGNEGKWNDESSDGSPYEGTYPKGYLVEYGGMPGDPTINISSSTKLTVPVVKAMTEVSRCGPGTLLLKASTNIGTLNWYDVEKDGKPIGTGENFTTASLKKSTPFYAAVCPNKRKEVKATVLIIRPLIVKQNKKTLERCGPGSIPINLVSQSQKINWYFDPNGEAVATGKSYTTPELNENTIIYFDLENNGCKSKKYSFKLIVKTIKSVTDASRCGEGSLTLKATSDIKPINWYAAPGGKILGTGETFTTPNINKSTTYYASVCPQEKKEVKATIIAHPKIVKSNAPIYRCGPGIVNMEATPSAGTINWYKDPKGEKVATGLKYTTPSINDNTTYYMEAEDNGCKSLDKSPLELKVALLNSVTAASRCGEGTLILKASSNTKPINWYAAPGGKPLGKGETFTTPIINKSTTYYAAVCPEQTKEVKATIIARPTIVKTNAPLQHCGPGIFNLEATPSAGIINWYKDPKGEKVATGPKYTTPKINDNTTYYLEAVDNGCTSKDKSALELKVALLKSVTAASRCGEGTLILKATSNTKPINWYAAPGGKPLGKGETFTTPIINKSTTYFAEVCPDQRKEVKATIIAHPTIVKSNSPIYRCGPGIVNMEATPSAGTVNWYKDPKGEKVATGLNYITPKINDNTTYYMEAEDNGCKSLDKVPSQLKVALLKSVTAASRCGEGTLILKATSNIKPINWYAAPGGKPLGNGETFTTPIINKSTTYYAAVCPQQTKEVKATIVARPTIVKTNEPLQHCGPGIFTMEATPSAGIVNWYKDPKGEKVATGPKYTTPKINDNTTYYMEAEDLGCKSRDKVPNQLKVSLLKSVIASSRCGEGTLILKATSNTKPINWYAAPGGKLLGNGETFTTPIINKSTTYYAEVCPEQREEVKATIIAHPTILKSNAPLLRCGPGIFKLEATPSAGIVNWYKDPKGEKVATGPKYTTPSINDNTTYYMEADNKGCKSIDKSALELKVALLNSVTAASRCGEGTLILKATSNTKPINWYAAPGGKLLGNGETFTTPIINKSTTYYAEVCPEQREEVKATIIAHPTILKSNAPLLRCGPGIFKLEATPSAGIVNWYKDPKGEKVATGPKYTTPKINDNTTYYMEAENKGCKSIDKSALELKVALLKSVTAASRCGEGTLILKASSNTKPINWYAAPGGKPLGNGETFTTPIINKSTTYYAEVCPEQRKEVKATIIAHPTIVKTNAPLLRCGPGTFKLEATPSAGIVNWYKDPKGEMIATGPKYTTPSINDNTTYYMEADNKGCKSIDKSALELKVALLNSVTAASRCGEGTLILKATSNTKPINWYATPGGKPLGSGETFTTPMINKSTTYYAEVCPEQRKEVKATIIAHPTIVKTNAPLLRCGPGIFNLEATPSAGVINWYIDPKGEKVATGPKYTTASINDNTTYYMEADNKGCKSIDKSALELKVALLKSVTAASRCGEGTLILKATSNTKPINWYAAPGGKLLGSGETFTTPIINKSTTYFAEVCPEQRKEVKATIIAHPTIVKTNEPLLRCGPGLFNLEATPSAGKINWYKDLKGEKVATGPKYTTPKINDNTTYYMEAEHKGCKSENKTPLQLTIYPLRNNWKENLFSCANSFTTLDAEIPHLQYYWNTGETTQSITTNTPGIYTVNISGNPEQNCNISKTINVQQYKKPKIKTIHISQNTVVVELTEQQQYYEFSLDNTVFQPSNKFKNVEGGTQTAFVRDNANCDVDSLSFMILIMPTHFSPNNDGINDLWEVKGLKEFPSAQVNIFDRYGKLVSSLNASNPHWDGTYNQRQVMQSDYWYVLKLDKDSPEQKGHFSLLR